jgi:hypothetical protein
MDRTEQSKSLYFPEELIDEKNDMLNSLLDIDCNLSRFICMLMPQIIEESRQVLRQGLNYRQVYWSLTTCKKNTDGSKILLEEKKKSWCT